VTYSKNTWKFLWDIKVLFFPKWEQIDQLNLDGIHLDIKSSNFVTLPKHNKNEEKLKEKEIDSIEDDQLECKIIDFNTSVLLPAEDAVAIKWYANGTRLYKAPEIRQNNLNENYNKQFYVINLIIPKKIFIN